MGLISTLKSILGVGGRPDREGEAAVAVEREPDPSAERTVTEPEPVASAGEGAETAAESVADEDAASIGGAEAGEPVETIRGIGPAYGDRLAAAGVETVAELADADAAELADRTDLSETRIRGWIEQARAE